MASGTYISINTAKIGGVSAQAGKLGGELDTTRAELTKLQNELSKTQNILDIYFRSCSSDVIPTQRLQKQKSKMEEIVYLLGQADQLAKDASNKLDTKTNALKLAVTAMYGLTAAGYTTAVSVITKALTGETDCGDDYTYVGEYKTKTYVNSKKNWSPKRGGETNDYSDYIVVDGFDESFVLWQRDYYNGAVACTATADAIVASIVTGKLHEPDKSYWSAGGCNWPNTKSIPNTSKITVQEQCRIICENVQKGNPVILRVPNHSVVAVGMKEGVDPTNAKPSDILIIDPGDGKVKTAAEIYNGWYKGTGQLAMQNNIGWGLRVAK